MTSKYYKITFSNYTMYVRHASEELYISIVQFFFTFHLIVPYVWYNLILFAYFILAGFILSDYNILKNKKNKIDIINYDSINDFGKVKYILSDKTGNEVLK